MFYLQYTYNNSNLELRTGNTSRKRTVKHYLEQSYHIMFANDSNEGLNSAAVLWHSVSEETPWDSYFFKMEVPGLLLSKS